MDLWQTYDCLYAKQKNFLIYIVHMSLQCSVMSHPCFCSLSPPPDQPIEAEHVPQAYTAPDLPVTEDFATVTPIQTVHDIAEVLTSETEISVKPCEIELMLDTASAEMKQTFIKTQELTVQPEKTEFTQTVVIPAQLEPQETVIEISKTEIQIQKETLVREEESHDQVEIAEEIIPETSEEVHVSHVSVDIAKPTIETEQQTLVKETNVEIDLEIAAELISPVQQLPAGQQIPSLDKQTESATLETKVQSQQETIEIDLCEDAVDTVSKEEAVQSEVMEEIHKASLEIPIQSQSKPQEIEGGVWPKNE